MNAQQVWQSQESAAPRMSLAYVRHGATALERRTRGRNALEYGIGVFTFALFTWQAWEYHAARPVMAAGLGLLALWSIYYIFRWRRQASMRALPADAGLLDTLRYQRRELERQRDVRVRSWRWWGPTVAPGVLLVIVSPIVELDPVPWGQVGFMLFWMAAGIALASASLDRERARLQHEIKALDSLTND